MRKMTLPKVALLSLLAIFCFLSLNAEDSSNYHIESKEAIREFFDDPDEVALKDRVLYLLDTKKNNFLIRGHLPELNGQFCYEDLMTDIEKMLAREGQKLSQNVQLHSISLMNPIAEHKEIEIEKVWFSDHTDKGSCEVHSLYGALIDPLKIEKKVREFVLHHHDVDGIKKLMNRIHDLMESEHEHDLVIYIHCNAGKDRTGEAAASYLMGYKGLSYDDAMHLNHQIAGRDLKHASVNAIRWEAFYLRDVKELDTVGEIKGH